MNEIFSLEGKQLLITGASSGIGRAMAIECSKAGASVVLTARNEERLQETLTMMTPGGHVIHPADMMQEEDVVNLAKSIPDKLDGVVLCAGINDKLIIKQISNQKHHKP